MSFSTPNLFTCQMIESDLYRILKKHKVSYRKYSVRRYFVNEIMCFEIYEESTYIIFKNGMNHIIFDNRHPNDIYDTAEMIGFLQGGHY